MYVAIVLFHLGFWWGVLLFLPLRGLRADYAFLTTPCSANALPLADAMNLTNSTGSNLLIASEADKSQTTSEGTRTASELRPNHKLTGLVNVASSRHGRILPQCLQKRVRRR